MPGGDLLEGVRRRAAAAAQVFVDDVASPLVEPGDVRHLTRVLRLRPGEQVVAADGRGSWRLCAFTGRSDPDPSGVLEPVGEVAVEPLAGPLLTVAFAPAKGDRPEWVVQKLTELGLDRVVPLLTDRSVVRWRDERARAAVDRLRRVAREAAAQCRRAWLPEVADVASVADVAAWGGAGGALAMDGVSPTGLAQLGGAAPWPALQCVAVGPEGGWTPAERAIGLPELGLAPHVLRADTAAVAAGVLLSALRAGTVTVGGVVDGPGGCQEQAAGNEPGRPGGEAPRT